MITFGFVSLDIAPAAATFPTAMPDQPSLDSIGIPVLVVTHRRSGTHLLMDLIRRQFPTFRARARFGENPHKRLYFSLDRLNVSSRLKTDAHGAMKVLRSADRPTLKSHNEPDMRLIDPANRAFVDELLAKATKIYCYRDGRAVMCSLQRFMQRIDPAANCSITEFLRQEENGMSRPAEWAFHVRSWMSVPGVHPIKYEQIVSQTDEFLHQLSEILQERPLMTQPLLPAPARHRWQLWLARLTRSTDTTNVVGRPRGRPPLKWPEAFTIEDREFFDSESGHLLKELGYEKDDAWLRP